MALQSVTYQMSFLLMFVVAVADNAIKQQQVKLLSVSEPRGSACLTHSTGLGSISFSA
jgi:hypothetical protein